MSVTRWNGNGVSHPNGSYVLYSDYVELDREVEEYRQANCSLSRATKAIRTATLDEVVAYIGDNQDICFCEEDFKCEYCRYTERIIAAIERMKGEGK